MECFGLTDTFGTAVTARGLLLEFEGFEAHNFSMIIILMWLPQVSSCEQSYTRQSV